jgi:hypothetical protein
VLGNQLRAEASEMSEVVTNRPVVVRGDLAACKTKSDIAAVRPSLLLSISALRSIRFQGEALCPRDLGLFWLLFALYQVSIVQRSLAELSGLTGASVDELRSSLARLPRMVASCESDRALKVAAWFQRLCPIRVDCGPEAVSWDFDSGFVRACRVGGRVRYAYLELWIVPCLGSVFQEQAYRACLAAATASLAYAGGGGKCVWTLDSKAAVEAFAAQSIGTLGREIVTPLNKRLERAHSRLRVRLASLTRDPQTRGRRATEVTFVIVCYEAHILEQPRVGIYGGAARRRLIEQSDGRALSGEWRVDREARRERQSSARLAYYDRKRIKALSRVEWLELLDL